MQSFGGPVLFLDRSDINTDEIIPAKYLTEINKDALRPHLLEDLKLEGFDPNGASLASACVLVTRANFGCGSSREHAPWALAVNGITLVVAETFARIFRQNMFNGGLLAIELASQAIDQIFALHTSPTVCAVDLDSRTLLFSPERGEELAIPFDLSPFDEALVRAGGWLDFADARY
jgi:3-isopropylmalate/(R)-2-methylmalate dehydratase small subunit